jgi:MFS family permease
MTVPDALVMPRTRSVVTITTLGIGQILAWGSSYYLPAVLAKSIASDTGWPLAWVVGGLSLGLLASGCVSPSVGRAIGRRGGRPILALGSVLIAAGLLLLAGAGNLPLYLAGWLTIGLGMGAGLYDPAFATLGRLFGPTARSAITTLTLFGGLASTVCWPLSAFLVTHVGWRSTCVVYAALHIVVLMPAYLFILPREGALPPRRQPLQAGPDAPVQVSADPGLFLVGLLGLTLTVSAMISTLLSVHLLTMLQSQGIGLAAAVSLGALIGPSQVGARTIEFFIARYHHPIWTKLASTLLVMLGIATLWMALPILFLPLIFYGAGIGLESIARGTLPLTMFDGPRYAAVMGMLAMPSLIVQAAAPSIGAALLAAYGTAGAFGTLTGLSAVNFSLSLVLYISLRQWSKRTRPAEPFA